MPAPKEPTAAEKLAKNIAFATPDALRAIKNAANAVAVAKAAGTGSTAEESALTALLVPLLA